MRQLFNLLLFGVMALTLGACHCTTCSIGLPGGACDPCPQPLKPLKRPIPRSRCELPRWPDRPVKCVTTQVARKCCHYECGCTEEGYQYRIEVCEITYKSLYTDGSSKIWTEVSRNPVNESPSSTNKKGWKTSQPLRHSFVCNRCDGDSPPVE